MSLIDRPDLLSTMAFIHADGHGVPISFAVGEDGLCTVTAFRLSLRFHFQEDSMLIDQEIFDDASGDLSHTIAHNSIMNGDVKSWRLPTGRFRLYGVTESILAGSTEILTPNQSSTCTQQTPLLRKVKIEPGLEPILLLSDSEDECEPPVLPHCRPLVDPFPPPVSHPVQSPAPSIGKPPLPRRSTHSSSIIDCLKTLSAMKGSKSVLSKIDYNSIPVQRVQYLPPTFDGDALFEFPPIGASSSQSQAKLLHGMDRRYDGHAWTRTITSNIKNNMGLTFRSSACLGHLRCMNVECDYITRVHRTSTANEVQWDGISAFTFDVGSDPPKGSTVVCKICKIPPLCLATCSAKIYYVLAKDHMTRACIHLGSHLHPVKIGIDRDFVERADSVLGDQVQRTPTATNSAIILEASKDLIGDLLLRSDDASQVPLSFDELMPVLDTCKHMSSPSIRNKVTTFRYLRRFGVMDSITKLRGSSKWAFVQESKFPGQGSESDKVFIFKMSEIGPGSGVDLVQRMQPTGDLENAWIMYDHVKRVKGWTTLACHVYDAHYCKVMTIAACDMQSEDAAAQTLFWRNLNVVMGRYGLPNPKFKGFMADSAQANWNAIRIVYGTGDPTVPMEHQERTCLFHWTQSLEKHTKASIRPDLQHQHRQMCKQYKDSKTIAEAEDRYLAIRSWWLSSGAATEDHLQSLDLWLAFWHFRYRQWGGFMQLVHFSLLCTTTC